MKHGWGDGGKFPSFRASALPAPVKLAALLHCMPVKETQILGNQVIDGLQGRKFPTVQKESAVGWLNACKPLLSNFISVWSKPVLLPTYSSVSLPPGVFTR